MITKFSLGPLLLATLIELSGCYIAAAQTTAPSEALAHEETLLSVASLNHLLDNNNLELSTDKSSNATRFCFKISLSEGPSNRLDQFHAIIIRDRDKSAMVVCTDAGECFAYMTDGLLVAIDHSRPGSVIRITEGSPAFTWQVGVQGKTQIDWHFDEGAKQSTFTLSLASILKEMLNNVTMASYDASTRTYSMYTPHSLSEISLFPDDRSSAASPLELGVNNVVKCVIDNSSNSSDPKS